MIQKYDQGIDQDEDEDDESMEEDYDEPNAVRLGAFLPQSSDPRLWMVKVKKNQEK